MILGETGAGKSSITASFLLEGAEFLSDDITPVIFPEGMPNLWPLNSTLKLRENAVKQLLIKPGKLKSQLREPESFLWKQCILKGVFPFEYHF